MERQIESIPDIESKKSEVGEIQEKLDETEKENQILAQKEKDFKSKNQNLKDEISSVKTDVKKLKDRKTLLLEQLSSLRQIKENKNKVKIKIFFDL